MINVDTVYQRVLALANKEQRGYITPQEFNLFANQAQMEILKQYFYDMNQWERTHGNELEFSDNLNLLEEKLAPFKQSATITNSSAGTFDVVGGVNDFYKLGSVMPTNKEVEIEEVSHSEYRLLKLSPLTRPRTYQTVAIPPVSVIVNPIYYWENNRLEVRPDTGFTQIDITYIKKPAKVEWGYVVLASKALYNANTSTHFQLHASEETKLVYKILALAGITLQDPGVYQIAAGEDIKTVQQEKQ
jgi:hypothetical protein